MIEKLHRNLKVAIELNDKKKQLLKDDLLSCDNTTDLNDYAGHLLTHQNIESRFSFKCAKQWEELSETEDDKVKLCSQCNESVYLAENINELNKHAEHGHCVSLQLKNKRTDSVEYLDLPIFLGRLRLCCSAKPSSLLIPFRRFCGFWAFQAR